MSNIENGLYRLPRIFQRKTAAIEHILVAQRVQLREALADDLGGEPADYEADRSRAERSDE